MPRSRALRANIARAPTCYHILMAPSRVAFAVLLLALLAGCPHKYKRSYQEPEAQELIDSVTAKQQAVHSFKTDSVMDYWIGKDRFRGTVLVMGELGAKVRMNALRPDDAVAADLACDGTSFTYVDMMNNCVLTGPCTGDSIASLLHVPLAPDDFLYLALGATPLIPGATATRLTWSTKRGREVLELEGDGGMKQKIELDGRHGKEQWDVVHSEVTGPDDKLVWKVDHSDYKEVTDAQGNPVRVPGKSHVITPADKSDLIVEWGGDREINLELDPVSWQLVPPSVPMCGSQSK